jgi:WhiB family redox-sensing transcriptional regulator
MENTNPLVVVRHGLEWQQDAACRGEMAAAFYPPLRPEKKHERLARERAAKAVCDTCTVRVECLDHAIRSDERYGIWGGMTDAERRHLPQSA